MSSNDNWVRDQVLAAHREIEQNRQRSAQYDANFKMASQRALVRIGAFFEKEFGTQSIDELVAMPQTRTDAAFMKFSASFDDEINELRGKLGGKRSLLIVLALVFGIGGLIAFISKTTFGPLGILGVILGFGLFIGAFKAYPLKPNALNGNQDLFLAMRCQQIADALRKRVNEKRADLGQ